MFKTICLLLGLSIFSLAQSQTTPPKRELRGAWIATYSNIDWPSRTQTPSQQQAALLTILNYHQQTGMNSIYLQVRSQCDALYPSTIEPWSADLTGTQGKAPSPLWDPMQYAITETHKRGMEFHAWLNPYRAVANTANLSGFASSHVAKQHPEWMLTVGTVQILNPALAAVRDYITSVVVDIVNRYDVDGIHFDDYFYPSGTINDNTYFTADPRGFTNIADWRRDNVNLLIKKVYDTILVLKPWVKFGVAPTGIYRNSTNPAIGTPTSGLEHYTTLYADSKKWIQQGWVDYLAPEVYWYIGQAGADYSKIVPWWNDNANGRHIYIGMAGYKVGDPAQGLFNTDNSMIPKEVRLNRSLPNVYGEIIYNTNSLRSNKLGFRDSLRLFFYQKPALQPLMAWRDNTPPAAASALSAQRYADDSVVLSWTKPAATSNELDKVKRFVIYRSTSPTIDINDANNILAITPFDTTAFRDVTISAGTSYYYTVTALDRFQNESAISNIVADVPPTINCPATQSLNLDAACSVTVPDYRSMATVANATAVTQSPAAGTTISGTGNHTITLTATNAVNQTATCTFTVVAHDITPPSIMPVTTSIMNGSSIQVNTDPGVCSYTASTNFNITATDNCSGTLSYSYTLTRNGITSAPVNATSLAGTVFQKGNTMVSWKVSDASGNSASFSFTVTVVDNEAPMITGISTDPSSLFPPNHKMKLVTVNYSATDNCGSVTTSLSVSSNEPQKGTGQGDEDNDWEVVDNHHVKLRAERAGNGDGRIYTITITATDGSGNSTQKTAYVTVPHDKGMITEAITEKAGVQSLASELTVSAKENPSSNYFVITTASSSSEPLSVNVTDAAGRIVESRSSLPAYSTLVLGTTYRPGLYLLEVRQGTKSKTIKLVKQ